MQGHRRLAAIGALAFATTLGAQTKADVDRFDQAVAAYQRGDFATVRKLLDEIIARDSAARARGDAAGSGIVRYNSPYSLRSQLRRKLGDTAGAERDLDLTLATTPALGSRDLVLGHLLQTDDPRAALAAFSRAIALDSLDRRAWYARAALRMVMDDTVGGRVDMERAAQLGDTFARSILRPPPRAQASGIDFYTMNRRADSIERSGDFRGAFAIYDSLARMKGWAIAFVNRARMHRRLGDSAAALKDLDSAVTLQPTLTPARLARGSLRLGRGDRRGAREDVEKVMDLDFNNPTNPGGLFDRGMLRIALGDESGGMEDVRRAAEMGWYNAQRVVNGEPVVDTDSLERTQRAQPSGAPADRAVDVPRDRITPAAPLERDAAALLARAVPWLFGLMLISMLFVGGLALWLMFTPENRTVRFDTEAGERQLWKGAPSRGLTLSDASLKWGLVPLLVVLGGGGFVFVQTDGFANGEWFVVAIPAMPILLLGLYQSFGRPFIDARRRKMTQYALTDRRAIMSVGNEIQAYPIESLRSATLTTHADGTGTIAWGSAEGDLERALERELERAMAEGRSPTATDVNRAVSSAAHRGFDRIPSPKTVFAKMQSVAAPAPAPASPPAPTPEVAEVAKAKRPVAVEVERSASTWTATNAKYGALLFSAFLLIGLAGTYFFGYRPIREYIAARDWVGLPCTIVSSRIVTSTSTSRDSDRRTRTTIHHDFEVAYRYQYQGRWHVGTRHRLTAISRGGMGALEAAQNRVAAFPAGRATTCWVDPSNPTNAVLDRGLSPGMLFGLAPLVFVALGALGLASVIRSQRAL